MRTTSNRVGLALAAIALAGAAAAQAPSFETPAARQLSRWLETFNAGDREAREQFLRAHWPSRPLQSVAQDLAFREQTGGFELLRIEEATATRATALVEERASDTVARLVVDVEAAEPHHIASVDARVVPRPADLAIPRLDDAELIAALAAELDDASAADRFAGTVLVARDGEPVFSDAYGLADRARGAPNTLETRFRNGSMNKMFTAVAVLALVQAGELALEDPLGKHLPDYPNRALASTVTIHHLLTHTGSTGDIFGPQFAANRLELRTHRDYVELYGARDLLFEPGSRWMYSNYGYVLLGAVIEAVSGQSYYDYVRERVYAPAGMTSTGSKPEGETVEHLSTGYMRAPGGALAPNTDTLPYRGTAAGGGYTTVGDLLRFANALTSHALLDAEHTALLTTGKAAAGPGRYAYGFEERVQDGLRSVGHSGGAPGMNGDLRIFDSGYVVAVLANADPPAAQRISDFIANRLPAPAAAAR